MEPERARLPDRCTAGVHGCARNPYAGAGAIGTGSSAHRKAALGLGVDAFVDLYADRVEDVGEVDVVFDVIGGKILVREAAVGKFVSMWRCDRYPIVSPVAVPIRSNDPCPGTAGIGTLVGSGHEARRTTSAASVFGVAMTTLSKTVAVPAPRRVPGAFAPAAHRGARRAGRRDLDAAVPAGRRERTAARRHLRTWRRRNAEGARRA